MAQDNWQVVSETPAQSGDNTQWIDARNNTGNNQWAVVKEEPQQSAISTLSSGIANAGKTIHNSIQDARSFGASVANTVANAVNSVEDLIGVSKPKSVVLDNPDVMRQVQQQPSQYEQAGTVAPVNRATQNKIAAMPDADQQKLARSNSAIGRQAAAIQTDKATRAAQRMGVSPQPSAIGLDNQPNISALLIPQNTADVQDIATSQLNNADVDSNELTPTDKAYLDLKRDHPNIANMVSGAYNMGAGVANVPNFLADTVKSASNNVLGTSFQASDDSPTVMDWQKRAGQLASDISKKKFSDLNGLDEKAQWLKDNVEQQAIQMIGSGTAAVLPKARAAYLTLMGLSSAGSAQAQGKANGYTLDGNTATSAIKGGLEVLTEYLPLGVFDKVKDTLSKLALPQQANLVGSLLYKTLEVGGAMGVHGTTEGIEEGTSQLGGNLAERYVAGDKKTQLMDQVPESMIIGAATGAGMASAHIPHIVQQPSSVTGQLGQALNDTVNNSQWTTTPDQEARINLSATPNTARAIVNTQPPKPKAAINPQNNQQQSQTAIDINNLPEEELGAVNPVPGEQAQQQPEQQQQAAPAPTNLHEALTAIQSGQMTANDLAQQNKTLYGQLINQIASQPQLKNVNRNTAISAMAQNPDVAHQVLAAPNGLMDKLLKDNAPKETQPNDPTAAIVNAFKPDPKQAINQMADATEAALKSPFQRPDILNTASTAVEQSNKALDAATPEAEKPQAIDPKKAIKEMQDATEVALQSAYQRPGLLNTAADAMQQSQTALDKAAPKAEKTQQPQQPKPADAIKQMQDATEAALKAAFQLPAILQTAQTALQQSQQAMEQAGKNNEQPAKQAAPTKLERTAAKAMEQSQQLLGENVSPTDSAANLEKNNSDQFKSVFNYNNLKAGNNTNTNQEPAAIPAYKNKGAARLVANNKTKTTGIQHEIAPHPEKEGAWTVRPVKTEAENSQTAVQAVPTVEENKPATVNTAGADTVDTQQTPEQVPPVPPEQVAPVQQEAAPAEKPAHEITEREHGQKMIAEKLLPEAEEEHAKAKAGKLHGAVTGYKTKKAAVAATKAQVESLKNPSPQTLKQAASLGDHYRHVRLALEAGQHVPDEVLRDYPDLAKDHNRTVAPAVDQQEQSSEGKDNSARFRAQTTNNSGMTAEDVTHVANAALDQMGVTNHPHIIVAPTEADLPAHIVDQIKEEDAWGNKGVYDGENIYLVAENLDSPADVAITIAHELIGHHGMRQVLGQQFKPTLWSVYHSKLADVRELGERLGYDMSKDENKLRAADEYIAEMAERGEWNNSTMQRVMAALRGFLRQLVSGIRTAVARFNPELAAKIGDVKYSDAEIRELLHASREYVTGQHAAAAVESAAPEQSQQTEQSGISPSYMDHLTSVAGLTPEEAFNQYRNYGHHYQAWEKMAKEAGHAVYAKKNAHPVEVYAVNKNKDVLGMATFDDASKTWTVHDAGGMDIRTTPTTTNNFARTDDALRHMQQISPDVRLVRRKESPARNPNNQPGNVLDINTSHVITASNPFVKRLQQELVDRGLWERGRDLRRRVQDKAIAVKYTQDAIQRAGGTVDDSSDIRQAMDLYHGRTGARLEQLEHEYVNPLKDQVAAAMKAGATADDIEEYLYARHAEERNLHIASINPNMPDGGSGMTTAEAQQLLASYAAKPFANELTAIGQTMDDVSRFKINLMESSGLISPEAANAMRQYQHYVPLKGDELDTDLPARTGRKFNMRGKESQRATGRQDKARHLIENQLLDTEGKIVRAEKNRVATTVLNLAEQNPDPHFWQVEPIKTMNVIDPKTGMVRVGADPLAHNKENVLVAKVDGQEYHIHMLDPNFAQAMHGAVSNNDEHGFIQVVRHLNNLRAMMLTMYNPEWLLTNMTRDIQTAALNASSDHGFDLAGEMLQELRNAYAGGGAQIFNPGSNHQWAQYYRELEMEGGLTKFFGMVTLEDKIKELQKVGKQLNSGNGIGRMSVEQTRKFFNAVQKVNEAVESAPRLAAYVVLRRHGWSKAKAAAYAKNLTVNFNRSGADMSWSSLYMFFNASIQDTARTFNAALKTKRGRALAGSLFTLGMMLHFLNAGWDNKDEDGIYKYDKLPQYKKDSTYLITFKHSNLSIPMPFGWSFFYMAGDSAADTIVNAVRGKNAVMSNVWRLAKGAFDSYNPMGSNDSNSFYKWLAKAVTPTAVRPAVELATNENSYGAPIHHESGQFDKHPKPFYMDHFKNASAPAIALSHALNYVSGGNEVKPGAINLHPEDFDYAFNTVNPGVLKTIYDVGNAGYKAGVQGADLERREIPFARKFMTDEQKGFDYSKFKEITQAVQTAKQEYITADPEDRAQLLKEYPQLGRLAAMNTSLGSAIAHINKIERKIKDSKTLADDVKQARLKELDARRESLQKRMVKAYIDAGWDK